MDAGDTTGFILGVLLCIASTGWMAAARARASRAAAADAARALLDAQHPPYSPYRPDADAPPHCRGAADADGAPTVAPDSELGGLEPLPTPTLPHPHPHEARPSSPNGTKRIESRHTVG